MLVIFSDLDGTLLDRETYSYAAALPALELVRAAGVPLVLSTSKTRAEVEPLLADLGFRHPYLAENGALAVIPASYFHPHRTQRVVRFGCRYESNVAALRRASRTSGVAARGFAEMTAAEVAELTGLPPDAAERARRRDHDEPFVIPDGEPAQRLLTAIEALGKRWTRGGRFFHL
ncbi:MAG TPA: mannosyl-3-phosphoglycerate phosphatase, partial [Solibacterales bacterium]|nr:mannosyl-3-phosphoglycerate phosphatase [Bryobacterales bacterium]